MKRSLTAALVGLRFAPLLNWIAVIATGADLTLVVLLAGAESASAAVWSLQSIPTPPGSTFNTLNGISCTSNRACTAVGYSAVAGSNYNTSTLVERWNGSSWSIQPGPNPPGPQRNALIAVSCTSRTFCVAVGQSGHGVLVERWNGRRWSIDQNPKAAGLSSRYTALNGVSCTSKAACTAVGEFDIPNGPELAERWNGSSWTIQRNFRATDFIDYPVEFSAVSCRSNASCVAVGASGGGYFALAGRWEGASWKLEEGGEGTSLHDVSCASSDACIAVGASLNDAGAAPLVWRWNGTSWSEHEIGSSWFESTWLGNPTLNGVSCVSKSACTAVGGFTGGDTPIPLVGHWNGTRWRTERPPFDGTLSSVSCASRTVCIAVGSDPSGGPIAARYS